MDLTTLHIEVTNRCTLECPACPRTTWKNILKRPVEKADLDIDSFEKFLDCAGGKKIERLMLCGDYGDCIYYPHLFEFIQRFRHKKFDLMTNGSYRPKEFWQKLSELLGEGDTITFGIDGLEDDNNQYRKNSDWPSVMLALDIMSKSKVKVLWQTIVFSFNYEKLKKIKKFAESKGAEFFAIKTHRYGDNSLRPPEKLIEINYEFKEEFNSNTPVVIEPQCETERVVTSNGYFLPCDWIRNPQTFYKSDLWKNRSQWIDNLLINQITLDQGLELIKNWKNLILEKVANGSSDIDQICKMRCRKGCVKSNILKFNTNE